MITRQQALQLIEKHVSNKNIIKHMTALEAVMGKLFGYLSNQPSNNLAIGGSKAEWMMAGLLHDGDYCEGVPVEKQGIQITEWAKESFDSPGGEASIPDNVAHAMAAHNWHNTKVEPETIMDWAIFCSDSLTGLIVACALVLPSRKLADVSTDMILKKFKSPSFAKGTRREDIKLCQEKLELPLEEFVKISLSAMQAISSDLGL